MEGTSIRPVKVLLGCLLSLEAAAMAGDDPGRCRLRISWGHRSQAARPFSIAIEGTGVELGAPSPIGLEPGEGLRDGAWETTAGGGDLDAVELEMRYPGRAVTESVKPHSIWAYLLERSDPATALRLRGDPSLRPDPRRIAVRTSREGTRGFALTVDQLLAGMSFPVPSLDVYVAAGDPPASFEDHARAIAPVAGTKVLDRVRDGPEASYEEYLSKWEDMGSPSYRNPAQVGPGHIVPIGWEGSLAKFGIDRGAGAWSDYGNPDRFRLHFEAGALGDDLARGWKGQRLEDGLPVITTVLERDGARYEVEQFAWPLDGPPPERRGDIPMVLVERIRIAELEGRARKLDLRMIHERGLEPGASFARSSEDGAEVWQEAPAGRTLLVLRGKGVHVGDRDLGGKKNKKERRLSIVASLDLTANGSAEVLLALPSPPLDRAGRAKLLRLDAAAAREGVLRFWKGWLGRGARFEVPEDAVNRLFRANLWHALRLPRRHGGPGAPLDLPYSNFAYDQSGIPWPVNQAVYVDSMLYDLRGHHDLSAEELEAIYRACLEPDGRVKGLASWGVYTPGMVYASARHFLLSGDRASFDRLLPPTLKALDRCLADLRRAGEGGGPATGLVLAPLNDLSHDSRAWAFNQAYQYAGLDLLGRALASIGHPRAAECADAARSLRGAIETAFGRASAAAPLVPLRDGTWSPYVPSDALAPRRLLEVWYPTDVDTGALHLPRLGALDPAGHLASCLLDDHEDNLFFGGLGMANEPVYNPQATVYLLRDEPKAAIRAFYSMMACAFSHSVLEPVEHRWAWGQYFGPPSTDGAWFELYRHMLIRERDDGSLLLLGAAPRKWLEDGKRIRIERAPTWFGVLSLEAESRAAAGEIAVTVGLAARARPSCLLVRLRHPGALPIRSATVDGAEWKDFDPGEEWVRIADPAGGRRSIVARY
jgi:hypothetical protein